MKFPGIRTYDTMVEENRLERLKRWRPSTAAELTPDNEPLWCWATPAEYHQATKQVDARNNYCRKEGIGRMGLCPEHESEILG